MYKELSHSKCLVRKPVEIFNELPSKEVYLYNNYY